MLGVFLEKPTEPKKPKSQDAVGDPRSFFLGGGGGGGGGGLWFPYKPLEAKKGHPFLHPNWAT